MQPHHAAANPYLPGLIGDGAPGGIEVSGGKVDFGSTGGGTARGSAETGAGAVGPSGLSPHRPDGVTAGSTSGQRGQALVTDGSVS